VATTQQSMIVGIFQNNADAEQAVTHWSKLDLTVTRLSSHSMEPQQEAEYFPGLRACLQEKTRRIATYTMI